MENINETVIICMIAIAIFQFTIIFTILRAGGKKGAGEITKNKRTLIDLLKNPVNHLH